MAIRNNTFILKRSNVVNKFPALSGLTLGELALNTADVKLYSLYTGGLTGATEVREIGWNRLSVSGGTLYGNLNVLGSVSATTFYGNGSNLTGINDYYVTGGTYSSGILTLNRQNGSVTVTGLLSADTFVTGFTYNNANLLTISQNQGQSPLSVNISVMTGLTIAGNLTVTGNTSLKALTGTTALFSSSGQNVLTVIGSGNTSSNPLFSIQGSSGELFSVTDSLVGALFSVNDISGLPILKVNSDSTILMGSYLAPSLNTTVKTTANSGLTTIYSIPTSAYTGAFFEYTVNDGLNLRAGSIMSIWSGSTINYN
jgi:hypothetical protein